MSKLTTLSTAALAGLLAGSLVACGGETVTEPAPAAEKPAAPAAEEPAAEEAAAEGEATEGEAAEGEVAAGTEEGEQPAASAEHACKGMNECKGLGGCHVEGKNNCAGKNDCKGMGGCCTMVDKAACPSHDDAGGEEKKEG